MTSKTHRACYLSTYDLANLNDACIPLRTCGYGAYLVGSALTDAAHRDVDVRVILPDEEFDRRFGDSREFWSIVCRGIAAHLTKVTGLPIDFQIQRETEANEKFPDPGKRNPLGIPSSARPFAGGGDATGGFVARAEKDMTDAATSAEHVVVPKVPDLHCPRCASLEVAEGQRGHLCADCGEVFFVEDAPPDATGERSAKFDVCICGHSVGDHALGVGFEGCGVCDCVSYTRGAVRSSPVEKDMPERTNIWGKPRPSYNEDASTDVTGEPEDRCVFCRQVIQSWSPFQDGVHGRHHLPPCPPSATEAGHDAQPKAIVDSLLNTIEVLRDNPGHLPPKNAECEHCLQRIVDARRYLGVDVTGTPSDPEANRCTCHDARINHKLACAIHFREARDYPEGERPLDRVVEKIHAWAPIDLPTYAVTQIAKGLYDAGLLSISPSATGVDEKLLDACRKWRACSVGKAGMGAVHSCPHQDCDIDILVALRAYDSQERAE